MQAILVAIAIEWGNRQNDVRSACKWNGQCITANGAVIGVLGRNGGNNQVIGVVAACKKDANKRFVIRRPNLRHSGIEEAQIANGGGQRAGAQSRAGCLAYELTASKN